MVEKVLIGCPKCGKENTVLWFSSVKHTTMEAGSAGIPHMVTRGRGEKVFGECVCGYKFKGGDLD